MLLSAAAARSIVLGRRAYAPASEPSDSSHEPPDALRTASAIWRNAHTNRAGSCFAIEAFQALSCRLCTSCLSTLNSQGPCKWAENGSMSFVGSRACNEYGSGAAAALPPPPLPPPLPGCAAARDGGRGRPVSPLVRKKREISSVGLSAIRAWGSRRVCVAYARHAASSGE